MIGEVTKKYHDHLYLVFRVVIGALIFTHGGIKVFGWYGGLTGAGPIELASLFGVAGIIEVVIGAAIVLGLWVRLAALIGAVEMAVAYAVVHLPNGISPFVNGGELVVLFFVSHLVFLVHGAQRWGLEAALWKKERF